MGNAPLWDALQEREKVLRESERMDRRRWHALGRLEGIVGDQGGYTAEVDAATLLQGLDIDEALHERKMSELQGGQKVRVLLACLGLQQRHRAAAGRAHQQSGSRLGALASKRYLLAYTGCLLVISHDRHFLNEVCTHTADIDYESIITYTGAYDEMVLAKTQIRARVEAGKCLREKKIAQLNDFIARFSAGTKVRANHPAQERGRAAANLRSRKAEHPTSLYSIPERTSFRTASFGNQAGLSKSYDDLFRASGLHCVHRTR